MDSFFIKPRAAAFQTFFLYRPISPDTPREEDNHDIRIHVRRAAPGGKDAPLSGAQGLLFSTVRRAELASREWVKEKAHERVVDLGVLRTLPGRLNGSAYDAPPSNSRILKRVGRRHVVNRENGKHVVAYSQFRFWAGPILRCTTQASL